MGSFAGRGIPRWCLASLAGLALVGCNSTGPTVQGESPTQPGVSRNNGGVNGGLEKRDPQYSMGPGLEASKNPKYLADFELGDFLEKDRPLMVEMKALDSLLQKHFSPEAVLKNKTEILKSIDALQTKLKDQEHQDYRLTVRLATCEGALGEFRKSIVEEGVPAGAIVSTRSVLTLYADGLEEAATFERKVKGI